MVDVSVQFEKKNISKMKFLCSPRRIYGWFQICNTETKAFWSEHRRETAGIFSLFTHGTQNDPVVGLPNASRRKWKLV